MVWAAAPAETTCSISGTCAISLCTLAATHTNNGERSGRPAGMAEAQGAVYEADALAKRETLELVRAYYRIKNEKVRKRVFELAKALAKTD